MLKLKHRKWGGSFPDRAMTKVKFLAESQGTMVSGNQTLNIPANTPWTTSNQDTQYTNSDILHLAQIYREWTVCAVKIKARCAAYQAGTENMIDVKMRRSLCTCTTGAASYNLFPNWAGGDWDTGGANIYNQGDGPYRAFSTVYKPTSVVKGYMNVSEMWGINDIFDEDPASGFWGVTAAGQTPTSGLAGNVIGNPLITVPTKSVAFNIAMRNVTSPSATNTLYIAYEIEFYLAFRGLTNPGWGWALTDSEDDPTGTGEMYTL